MGVELFQLKVDIRAVCPQTLSVMAVTAGLSLLVLMAAAQNQPTYFEFGKKAQFDPKYPEAITSVTWKHNGNIIGDFVEGTTPPVFRGTFKGRSEIDRTTGTLTVRNLRKSDDGVFTVEINTRNFPVSFSIVVLRRLDDNRVDVTVRPRGCSNLPSLSCTLVCGGKFEDAEPVQYFWKKENGQWKEGNKTITVSIFNNSQSFPRHNCKVKNLFSEKASDPKADPFRPTSSSVPVPVLLPALLLLALLALGSAVIV